MGVYFHHTGGDKELVFVEDKLSLPSEGEVNKLYVVRKNEGDRGELYLWDNIKRKYEPIGSGIETDVQGNIAFKKVEW